MMLGYAESVKLLKKYNIGHPNAVLIKNADNFKKSLRFPVVLKVDSPDVVHKSDIGLVFTGLRNPADVRKSAKAAVKVLNSKKISNYRLIVQEQLKGVELIVGMKRDETFGPVIVFGIGGVLVEIMSDVSMRIAPLTKQDCLEMIEEIKGRKLLNGYRNLPKVDKKSLVKLLLAISKMSLKEKKISEIDFNPVIAAGKNILVADARIVKNA